MTASVTSDGSAVLRTRGGPVNGTSLPVLVLCMLLTIAPLIALSQVLAWWRTDVVDDQMFGYFGWRIANGATVYLDVWDNKPPGIYWINALGMLLGGGSYYGVVAMCVLALLVAHTAFFIAAASVYHRGAAAVTTILLSFYLTHPFYTGGTNRTETFLVACELTALACYLHGWIRDRGWKWYAAGVLCGAAFLFKQVGLALWGSLGLHLIILMVARRLSAASGVRRGLLLLAGAASTVAVAAAALAAQGALGAAWFATFTFNGAYFSQGVSQFPYNYVTYMLERDHIYPILLLPLLMAAAAWIHAVLWALRPAYRPTDIAAALAPKRPTCPAPVLLFTLWLAVAFYGALLSPHGFRHYLVPVIPPLLMIAGYLVNALRAEMKLLRRMQQRAWVTAAFVAMAYFAWGAVRLQFEGFARVWVARIDPWLNQVGTYEPAHWEVVGDAVARWSGPADRIHCWGYMPGVYLQARRINASRFTTTEKVGQVGAGARFVLDELVQTLRDRPPELLTITAEDYLWLHGRSQRGIPTDVELGGWIDETYTLVQEIPRFGTVYIYKRRDLVDGDAATRPATAPGAVDERLRNAERDRLRE